MKEHSDSPRRADQAPGAERASSLPILAIPAVLAVALAALVLFGGLSAALARVVPQDSSSSSSSTDDQSVEPQQPHKLTRAEKRRQKAIRKEMESPYKDFIEGPTGYIITPEERSAFKKLTTDDEREQFIEAFWQRRNPNPGDPENEYQEEFYRRVAYANEHFASGIPGWRTYRGRIYVMYGPPD